MELEITWIYLFQMHGVHGLFTYIETNMRDICGEARIDGYSLHGAMWVSISLGNCEKHLNFQLIKKLDGLNMYDV